MDLHSVNYLHCGAAKQWYVIPPAYRARFERLMASLLQDLFRACPEFMRHKVRAGGGWRGGGVEGPPLALAASHRNQGRCLALPPNAPQRLTTHPPTRLPACTPAGAAGVTAAAGQPLDPGGARGAPAPGVCGGGPRRIPQVSGSWGGGWGGVGLRPETWQALHHTRHAGSSDPHPARLTPPARPPPAAASTTASTSPSRSTLPPRPGCPWAPTPATASAPRCVHEWGRGHGFGACSAWAERRHGLVR